MVLHGHELLRLGLVVESAPVVGVERDGEVMVLEQGEHDEFSILGEDWTILGVGSEPVRSCHVGRSRRAAEILLVVHRLYDHPRTKGFFGKFPRPRPFDIRRIDLSGPNCLIPRSGFKISLVIHSGPVGSSGAWGRDAGTHPFLGVIIRPMSIGWGDYVPWFHDRCCSSCCVVHISQS